MTVRVGAALATLAIFAMFFVGGAYAAFPGTPGPIVYPRIFVREVAKPGPHSRSGTTGGLFVHGPRVDEEPRQLTFDPRDRAPSFSADGRKIVFEGRADHSNPGIYVMNKDGSGRRLVTEDGMQPAFFPDSRRIVFMRDNRIFSIGIDGAGLRQITHSPFPDHEPTVSPDGKTIAFVRTNENEDIFVAPSGGGKARLLIDRPSDDDDPEWAPDGCRIAFTSNRGGCYAGIYIARADGRRVERLTPCDRLYNFPAFSPDGRHVIALRYNDGHTISLMRSDRAGIVGTVDRGHMVLGDGRFVGSSVGAASWGPRPR
jgi:Tol biopolymer transport system component